MQLRDHDNKETDVDTGDKRSHADQGKHDSKKQKTKQEEDNIGNETLDHKEAEDRGAKPHDESNGKLPKSTPAKQNKQASRPKRSEKTGDLIFEDYPEFRPNLTPKDVLQIGSFGGTYFRPIHSQETGQDYKDDYKEFPDDWFEGLDIGKHVISPDYDANINRFKVKCGQTLEQWEEQGWIRDHDPRGWFQWYCRFYEGRRCEDDAYQLGRWKRCASEHSGRWRRILLGKYRNAGITEVKESEENHTFAVERQILLHWGFNVKQDHLDAFKHEKGDDDAPADEG